VDRREKYSNKVYYVSPFARKPVPPVMRKFLAPRNSATPIPPPAAPGGSPCAGSTKDGSGGGGLDEPAAVAEDDDEQHATAPPPCRRLDDDDSSGRRRPRRRRDPSAAPKPGRTARERFTQELPIGPRARGRKEMQVRAWLVVREGKLSRAVAVAVCSRVVVGGWVLRRSCYFLPANVHARQTFTWAERDDEGPS
jgi:hypothetical protein